VEVGNENRIVSVEVGFASAEVGNGVGDADVWAGWQALLKIRENNRSTLLV
jgi:hypothetical protein